MTHDVHLPVTMTRNSDLRVGGPNLPLGPPPPPPPPVGPNLAPEDRGYSTRSLEFPYPYPFLPYTASSASLREKSKELLTKVCLIHLWTQTWKCHLHPFPAGSGHRRRYYKGECDSAKTFPETHRGSSNRTKAKGIVPLLFFSSISRIFPYL